MNIAIARATVSRISWGGRLPQGIEQEGLDPLGFQQPFELQRSDARVGLAQLAPVHGLLQKSRDGRLAAYRAHLVTSAAQLGGPAL